VINNVAIPNDPAIMQMHLPPQQNFAQNFSPMQHSNSSQSSFGPFGHMPGMNAPMGQNLPPQQQPQQSQSPTTRQQGNDFSLETKNKKPKDFAFENDTNQSKIKSSEDCKTSRNDNKGLLSFHSLKFSLFLSIYIYLFLINFILQVYDNYTLYKDWLNFSFIFFTVF
jgi:hypothetical protein